MKEKRYDVIIVGAGPAGLMLARYLESTSLRTLLIDSGSPRKHNPKVYGTCTDVVKKYKLERFVRRYFDRFAYYSAGVRVSRLIGRPL